MNPDDLRRLPVEDGMRLRGLSVTRTEAFTDAAFAFAVTLLVISTGDLPDTMEEFRLALRRIPAFVASFALLAMFWASHNAWSRRYGIEDRASRLLSLGFVLSVLVFVYPLRMVAASLFSAFSGNWLPAELRVREPADLQYLFTVYSSGYLVLCGFMLALHVLAARRADALGLDALELHDTRTLILSWCIQVVTAIVSIGVAALREPPPFQSILAPGLPGFVYCSLAVTLPLLARRRERDRGRLLALRS